MGDRSGRPGLRRRHGCGRHVRGASRSQPRAAAIALSGRRSRDEDRLIIETDTRHRDVSAGMPASHELVAAGTEVPSDHPEWSDCLDTTLASLSADDDHELAGDQVDRLV